jgi:cholesterol transport system auxiliary component
MRFFKRVGLVLAVLGVLGCSATPRQIVVHDFGAPPVPNVDRKPVAVSVNAPSWLWDTRLRYRRLYAASSEVRFYGIDQWVAAPPALVEQYLRTTLSGSKYPLVLQLSEFEQQFSSPTQAQVVLRFSVTAYAPGQTRVVAEQSYALQRATPSPDAAGAIAAYIELLRESKQKLEAWSRVLP